MLKHCVGKGRNVMKQHHVCLRVLQYYAIEHVGYVLYRALVHIEFILQAINQQRKYGRAAGAVGGGTGGGVVNSANYGTSKRSLGAR